MQCFQEGDHRELNNAITQTGCDHSVIEDFVQGRHDKPNLPSVGVASISIVLVSPLSSLNSMSAFLIPR